ncbi:hypothetical protein ACFSSA_06380 [Luteolibacter algae]|uniref:SCO family protein n=1 Tax=Luteolibacter algae TaxID=454151 RepID=A0ABW5D7C8_9BACT
MQAPDLQPVTPDPKKLLRTALILVLIMVLGGIFILKAYQKRTKETSRENVPSFLFQISETKDLNFVRQDGKISELLALKGKVLVIQCLPQSQPDETTIGVMKRLAEKYKSRDDVALVTLVLDPGEPEQLVPQLSEVADTLGAELPQWTVASNERPTLHRFIKNEFKASMLPHEKDGKWIYDQSIVLVDRERHIRRAVVPQKRGGAPFVAAFDFEKSKQWDEEGIKTGTDLNNVEQLEVLLGETIEILLNEKSTS